MENNFLKQKFDGLHISPEVESATKRKEVREGSKKITKPTEKIEAHLDRLDEIFSTEDNNKRKFRINFLKDKLHDKFIIKPEDIPESYYDQQRRIVRQEGHGDVEITPNMRKDAETTIVADQKASLDTWIDYLGSKDATYPNYLKYFAFRGIIKLGKYNKEKQKFANRTKETVAPFIELNREALAYVLDALEKEHQGQEQGELSEEFKKYLKNANFGKMYAQAIKDIYKQGGMEKLDIHDGKWIKYEQGNNYQKLHKSLQGKATGWCTAGESTANTQLKNGDFYVYYTKNNDGQYTEPRIAIRMNGKNKIGEIRGAAPNQNLESEAEEILDEKLTEFPDSEAYKQKSHDMKLLTQIEEKQNNNQELSKEDLKFLYEVNNPIKGFGYQKDPRIKEIQDQRNVKKDLSFVFECSQEQISATKEEALKGDIKFHYGNLDLYGLQSAEGLTLPESIGGGLYLSGLKSAEGLKLPENIGGDIILNGLQSAEGLELPENIGGGLYLNGLRSAEGLKLPESINGDLDLSGLQSAEGLKLPENISGNLDLRGLQSAEKEKLREKYPNLNII